MEKWTLKSIIEKAKKIVEEKKPDTTKKLSVSISICEDSDVHFSLRFGRDILPFDDEINEETTIYVSGNNPDELLFKFIHQIDLQYVVSKRIVTDFPYEHE